jgi:hypothetical protein
VAGIVISYLSLRRLPTPAPAASTTPELVSTQ